MKSDKDSLGSIIRVNYGIDVLSTRKFDATSEVYMITSKQGAFIFKSMAQTDRLPLMVMIADCLQISGISCTKPIITRKKKLFIHFDSETYYLSAYLEGETLLASEYLKQIGIYGNLLARFHESVSGIEPSGKVMDIRNDTIGINYPILVNHFDSLVLHECVNIIEEHLDSIDNLPIQLIHRDYHCDNVLFVDDNVSGMIDFDSCMFGYPLYDIAYFLAELLVHNPKIDIMKYMHEFVIGYETKIRVSDKDKQLILPLMMVVHLDFASWFVEIGDFASARESLSNLEEIYNIYRNEENK